ncbi:unnamed protein product [Rotaria magnacalcarata]|uniref:Uncharacterized protein n=1 Tax=Rotaria magnacalcarata TaxID=392030 RepID=A0A816BFW3_9BILA|nr:unnamed protein product [Rotaria magnacalcarata]CAF4086660.1 unnamed protein product [Rotaria magnacalcarata]CAF4110834.1 unnamed protein product [Rotaria magnacalcarata]CAF4129178.1 unnamed protein product [Rotaria magnacalcarata]
MSTEPPPPPPPPPPLPTPQKLDFAPLHRSVELENIHAQVIKNDPQQPESKSTRKILVKHMTVIGDGSDMDNSEIITQ